MQIEKRQTNPKARQEAIIQGAHYRITVLTDRMLRLEYQEQDSFEDEATQIVVNRDFDVPNFRVLETEGLLEIVTDQLHLYYDKKAFSREGLSIDVAGHLAVSQSKWSYGEELRDLRGTARTLDEVDGGTELDHGLLSREGFSVIDDSASYLVAENGWVRARKKQGIDLYFLGYGRDYKGCLRDFFRLCGDTPMVPRFALGNWWSRFHRYTDREYRDLIEQFEDKGLPFSVAVIDMDWHITRVDAKYGSGWTGYTWDPELFPDPEDFLDYLHQKGMHVTLNEHPADGVRAFEKAYPAMAKALHIDYEHEDKIPFDVTSPEFMKAYFEYLHKPMEQEGVDFWWVDWQQGQTCRLPGLDPLWMLNHLHYLYQEETSKHPLIFSRYAGIGSHRYPIGFSGDSVTTWDSLRFQPYFTANASNAGYCWWSHDIGGHMMGCRDDELSVRWLQFGVFSPIMRLHSSGNPFYEKEPWKYNQVIEGIMTGYLRLRHKLIPYLYTMDHRLHAEGIPLVEPVYYEHPEAPEAYEVPNQYYFGSELMVCPITEKSDPQTRCAGVESWIPEGIWYDFFLGRIYQGGRSLKLYRDLENEPVLVKAGAVLPMDGAYANAAENPQKLELHIYAGADGSFRLYEDREKSEAWTEICWTDRKRLTIVQTGAAEAVITEKRSCKILIHGSSNAVVMEQGEVLSSSYDAEGCVLSIMIPDGNRAHELTFACENGSLQEPSRERRIFDLLNRAQIAYQLKDDIYRLLTDGRDLKQQLGDLRRMQPGEALEGALLEILLAS